MDNSHLDYRRLDYTLLDIVWCLDYRSLDYKDVWTIPIGLLVYLDNQNLDYTPNRVHYHLDYIRQTMLNCAMYFVLVVQNSPNGDSPNIIVVQMGIVRMSL